MRKIGDARHTDRISPELQTGVKTERKSKREGPGGGEAVVGRGGRRSRRSRNGQNLNRHGGASTSKMRGADVLFRGGGELCKSGERTGWRYRETAEARPPGGRAWEEALFRLVS